MKNEEARVEELRRDGRASEAEARVLNRADGSESVPCGGPKALRTGGGADWSESVPERSCLDWLGSIFSGAMAHRAAFDSSADLSFIFGPL